jgi:hypothetical protein
MAEAEASVEELVGMIEHGELREFGECRRQRLVLAAWDQLSAGDLK